MRPARSFDLAAYLGSRQWRGSKGQQGECGDYIAVLMVALVHWQQEISLRTRVTDGSISVVCQVRHAWGWGSAVGCVAERDSAPIRSAGTSLSCIVCCMVESHAHSEFM